MELAHGPEMLWETNAEYESNKNWQLLDNQKKAQHDYNINQTQYTIGVNWSIKLEFSVRNS